MGAGAYYAIFLGPLVIACRLCPARSDDRAPPRREPLSEPSFIARNGVARSRAVLVDRSRLLDALAMIVSAAALHDRLFLPSQSCLPSQRGGPQKMSIRW